MAINTTWTVKIGTVASPTDFTSRVMGMQIDQNVDVNVIGRGSCQITLLNKDGALTPGGGGTYSSTDWFAQGVFVEAVTDTGGASTSHAVFHGIVTDFDLIDDGVFSTVTITALDGLTVAGNSFAGTVGPIGSTSYDVAIAVIFDPGLTTLAYPKLGKTTALGVGTNLSGQTTQVLSDSAVTFDTYASLWQQGLIPSANDVLWATKITAATTSVEYRYQYIPMSNSRTAALQVDMEFDPPASLSGSKLPFYAENFTQQFNNDTLVTQTQLKANYTGAAQINTQASTVGTYGSRTLAFTNTFMTNATAVTAMGTKLLNRYSQSRFSPSSLSLSSSLVKKLASDSALSKWRELLSIENGLWQRAKITWTGSGAASQTAYSVIKGRRITVTPEDAVVTLNLANWADNHGFILDVDQLNVDKLG